MNATSSSPLSGFGTFLQFVAVVGSSVVGFKEMPAIMCIFGAAVLFEIAYVFVRLPQMVAVWSRDGFKIVKLVIMQLVLNAMIAAVFYWLGRGAGRLFS